MAKIPLHGWLNLDKASGISSTKALGRVKYLTKAMKAGHAGTLDPLASGVLPIAFGEATKLTSYMMDCEKTYSFTVRWGEQRSTDDLEGDVVAVSARRPSPDSILEALPLFIGAIEQIPPAYSALKIDGERAYHLARQGYDVSLAPRRITIHRLELIDCPHQDEASFRVACGKGTYIRSLARDLGAHLGCLGTVKTLIRERVGRFSREAAISLEKLEELVHNDRVHEGIMDISSALDDIPALDVTAAEAARLKTGQTIVMAPSCQEAPGKVRIAREQEHLIALVIAETGFWRVQRGFSLTP
jgi:tRNA pseudouridine55 synthase